MTVNSQALRKQLVNTEVCVCLFNERVRKKENNVTKVKVEGEGKR